MSNLSMVLSELASKYDGQPLAKALRAEIKRAEALEFFDRKCIPQMASEEEFELLVFIREQLGA